MPWALGSQANSVERVRELLFLAHRIPYPPTKGDKIRSWHIFRHLAQRFEIHLGCLIDDPEDWRHTDMLRQMSASCYFAPLSPRQARWRSLSGLVRGVPLTLPYFYHAGLAEWVAKVAARRGVAVQFLYSSAMAAYDGALRGHTHLRLVDFVDLDSQKWADYARTRPWPLRSIYAREARRLGQIEARLAAESDAVLFVSEAEAALFARQRPEFRAKTLALPNGVDLDFFDPAAIRPNPYEGGGPVLVFTGAMDYWPNSDAVIWFTEQALPRIHQTCPEARFYIVGARPSERVRELARRPGVTVTGRVPDIRPYLQHADLAVAPLRIARGIQNKVLEAMAMARPVLATPQAFEGIVARPGEDIWIAADAEMFAKLALQLIREKAVAQRLARNARRHVVEHYGWPKRLSLLDSLLETAQAA